MTEQEIAIEFAEWIFDNRWTLLETSDKRRWCSPAGKYGEHQLMTDEQLFTQFLKENKHSQK